jgi:hypothetical protein
MTQTTGYGRDGGAPTTRPAGASLSAPHRLLLSLPSRFRPDDSVTRSRHRRDKNKDDHDGENDETSFLPFLTTTRRTSFSVRSFSTSVRILVLNVRELPVSTSDGSVSQCASSRSQRASSQSRRTSSQSRCATFSHVLGLSVREFTVSMPTTSRTRQQDRARSLPHRI